ncbi:Lrp/AsnC family transcriptional regulator [Pseudoteredinibacter isoporae]|uniref:DNA-binding Lrp family transcriptional regulator n=1 Tax=Pseudoteredinibacter isoporae TaxID=570281 RepID=A0A7X0JRQ4_9GAMM|nr:Lrp/AsnC family transcriptional regulator [Pseudoteredinibacter isoporae]MBB6520957.1 DNA-binding Lrp family transcriptional regulator [Pseudoteredinibacter isoporae]
MDKYDAQILHELQTEGRLSNRDLAERIALSPAPCWRRVKRLEDEGYIRGYSAQVNHKKIGLQIIAFVEVSLNIHHPETIQNFLTMIANEPGILECHSVTGQCDYLLKIVSKDMESYETFVSTQLLTAPGIRSVNTLISMRQNKLTSELPVALD